jgi:hypothetical protein
VHREFAHEIFERLAPSVTGRGVYRAEQRLDLAVIALDRGENVCGIYIGSHVIRVPKYMSSKTCAMRAQCRCVREWRATG